MRPLLRHVAPGLAPAPAFGFREQSERGGPQPAQRHRAAPYLLVVLAEGAVFDVMQPVLDPPVAAHECGEAPARQRPRAARPGVQVVVDLLLRGRVLRVPGKPPGAAGDDLDGGGPQRRDVVRSLGDPVGALDRVAAIFFPASPPSATPSEAWRTSVRAGKGSPSGSPSPGRAPVCPGRRAPRGAAARRSPRRR